jgi:hypothetical protein
LAVQVWVMMTDCGDVEEEPDQLKVTVNGPWTWALVSSPPPSPAEPL